MAGAGPGRGPLQERLRGIVKEYPHVVAALCRLLRGWHQVTLCNITCLSFKILLIQDIHCLVPINLSPYIIID